MDNGKLMSIRKNPKPIDIVFQNLTYTVTIGQFKPSTCVENYLYILHDFNVNNRVPVRSVGDIFVFAKISSWNDLLLGLATLRVAITFFLIMISQI